MKTVIVATQNRHKIDEIEAITSSFGFKLISRDEAGIPPVEIEETGETFEENSFLKAFEIMKISKEITIADDSGLEVDFLNGAPGVYSARFSGKNSTDQANNEKLIALLKNVPFEKRTGRFVSVITIVFPCGKKIVARGTVEGHILLEEKGFNGFGYDPLFLPLGFSNTFGELSAEEKNKVSHRKNALEKLKDLLEKEDF